MAERDFRVVFLCAGFATRLLPLTKDRAKPLLEVGGEPILTRLARQVQATGRVRDGVLVSNARFEADFAAWIENAKLDYPVQLVNDGVWTNETRLGAVRDLALAVGDEHSSGAPDVAGYLVVAGDNLFDFELRSMLERFADGNHPQLLVREVPPPVPPGRYSEVRLDDEGRVTSFREKPEDPESNLSAIAVYVLPADLPELLAEYLAADLPSDAPGHFLAWLCARREVHAQRLSGRFFDIGNHEQLAAARSAFGEGNAKR